MMYCCNNVVCTQNQTLQNTPTLVISKESSLRTTELVSCMTSTPATPAESPQYLDLAASVGQEDAEQSLMSDMTDTVNPRCDDTLQQIINIVDKMWKSAIYMILYEPKVLSVLDDNMLDNSIQWSHNTTAPSTPERYTDATQSVTSSTTRPIKTQTSVSISQQSASSATPSPTRLINTQTPASRSKQPAPSVTSSPIHSISTKTPDSIRKKLKHTFDNESIRQYRDTTIEIVNSIKTRKDLHGENHEIQKHLMSQIDNTIMLANIMQCSLKLAYYRNGTILKLDDRDIEYILKVISYLVNTDISTSENRINQWLAGVQKQLTDDARYYVSVYILNNINQIISLYKQKNNETKTELTNTYTLERLDQAKQYIQNCSDNMISKGAKTTILQGIDDVIMTLHDKTKQTNTHSIRSAVQAMKALVNQLASQKDNASQLATIYKTPIKHRTDEQKNDTKRDR